MILAIFCCRLSLSSGHLALSRGRLICCDAEMDEQLSNKIDLADILTLLNLYNIIHVFHT